MFVNVSRSTQVLPIFYDETLSSDEAYLHLKTKRQQTRGKINKKDIDKIAAAIMLESWMHSNL